MFGDIPRSAFALACAGWLALASVDAKAAPAPLPPQLIDLKYDVAPSLGCPDAVEFRAMLAERLGRDPHREGAAMRVDVRARPVEQGQGQGIEGTIRWSGSADPTTAERHFSPKGRDCAELMATVAFVLAVQIKLADGGASEAAAPADELGAKAPEVAPSLPVTQPETPPQASAAVESHTSSSSVPSWILDVGIGPSVGVALAPNVVALGRVFVAAHVGRAAVELGVEASWPTRMYQDHGGGFRHQLTLGSLAACVGHKGLQLCGVGKLGALNVHGLAVDNAESPTGFVAFAGGRAAYTLDLGDHVALLAHGDALALLTPWTVSVNRSDIWVMPRFGGNAGIDLLIRFR